MLLRELLDVPAMGIRRITGDDASWARPVRWVYTTDLLDPGRYLSGGELVVTGLMWRRSPDDSERFVATLAHAGVAGLAAGDALLGDVPADLVDACDRHGLPLMGVAEDVSFAALTEHVASAVTAARGARLAATVRRQRQLLADVAEGRGLDAVAAQVSTETGTVCRVLTASGRQVVPGPEPLADTDVDRLVATYLSADRLPAVWRPGDGPTFTVVPVGATLGQRLTSWFVAVQAAGERDASADEVVTELAAVAALDRTVREESGKVTRAIAEDALAMVSAGGAAQSELAARLRQLGLDPQAPLAAVSLQLAGPGTEGGARAVLEDVAAPLGPAVVVDGADGATALVAATDPAFAARLRRGVERLGAGLRRGSLHVGVSEPVGLAALAGAVEEARHARRLAALRPGPVEVVASDEVTSHVVLLAAVPDEVRRSFTARVLGAVLVYDEQHRAGLVETLRVFLDCSGSWSRAATALDLHVNTVRYRIGRVEELTGRDLSRLEDRVDVFLALHQL